MSDEKKSKKAGRKKGTPKTGGRSKGTPNRNSLSVRQALDKANYPLIEMFLADVSMLETPAARLAELKWLFQFCYPKLKDIELGPSIAPPPPAGAAAQAAEPDPSSKPRSREERLALIRGQVPGKSSAPG